MKHHHSVITEHESDMKLIDYIQFIVNKSKLICLVTAVSAACAVVYSLTLPNIYTAKAMVLPVQEDKGLATAMLSQMGGLANFAASAMASANSADLYVTLLKSETVRDPIIDRFKLMEAFGKQYRSDVYPALDQSVTSTIGKKDGIITITVDDRNPRRAADLANALVDELQKVTVQIASGGASRNRSFLESRVTAARADLARAEEALKSFQSKNKAIQITEQAKASIEGISNLRAQLALAESELATLRQRYTNSSQEVKQLVATTSNLRHQIAQFEEGGGKGALPQLGSVPQLGQEYLKLMRELKIQEALVELLTKQFEMARLTEAKDVSPINVLQKARIPERKSKPSRAKLVIKTTILAFFSSLLLAFALESIAKTPPETRDRWKSVFRQLPLIGRFCR